MFAKCVAFCVVFGPSVNAHGTCWLVTHGLVLPCPHEYRPAPRGLMRYAIAFGSAASRLDAHGSDAYDAETCSTACGFL